MAIGRLVVLGVRYGVKYGPHAKVVLDQVKEPATDYLKRRVESQRGRRLAAAKARTLQDGTILEVVHRDSPVWVTFSGEEPVSAHPDAGVPLEDLLRRADLTRRRRPDDVPTVRDRAAAVREKAVGSVRRRQP